MIRYLAFDLDGTLLQEDKTIDSLTKASIQKAIQKGYHIIIASGRDKNGCQFVIDPLELEKGNHYLALVNGQIIYDFQKKEYNVDRVLQEEDGIKIQRIAKQFGIEAIFMCGYDFYCFASKMMRLKKKIRSTIWGEPMDYGLKNGDHRNFIDLGMKETRITQDINKVIMIQTESFFKKNMNRLKEALHDYDVLMVGNTWMEIMPKGVSKASAIETIVRSNGDTMDMVMAFGDAHNDKEMIQKSGIGVAMGNAMDDVKAIADVITDTNMNHGIQKVIDALLMGKEIDLRQGTL